MKITYSPRAVADLLAISAYIKPRSPQGAANVQAAILRTVAQLEHFAKAGTPQSTGGVRKLVVRKYPYLVFYVVVEADEISIVTIQHAARAPELADVSLIALCERRGIAMIASIDSDSDFDVYRLPKGKKFENIFQTYGK